MEAKTYNAIVRRTAQSGATPLLLLLLCLPEDHLTWLENDEERLLLRKCCYWAKVKGEQTDHTSTVTISIPRMQLLTPENLPTLFDEFSKRG